MQARVVPNGAEGSLAETDNFFVGRLVKDGGLNLIKVQNELLADNVLDRWVRRRTFVARQSRERWVCACALGEQVLRPRLGRGGVLGDGGLDAFDGEPMCYELSACHYFHEITSPYL